MVTPMEFKEDIQKRRTTFQFTGTPVTAEQIKWIIRAGITAPSFANKRKWNLIAVTSEMAKRSRSGPMAVSAAGEAAAPACPAAVEGIVLNAVKSISLVVQILVRILPWRIQGRNP